MNRLPFEQGDEQFELEMQQVADIYRQLSIELFENIIRRLKKRGTEDLIREPYIWQLEKLNDMYMLTEENVKLIAKRSEVAESVLRDVIENEGYKVYQDVHGQLARDLGVSSTPNRYGTQEALKGYANQTVRELGNLINTTLPKSVQDVYKSVIEQIVAGVVIGAKSADKALSETLMKWFDKGFYGFTDKAGRKWRAETYARTIIKTTTFRVYRDMRERPAEEMGVDTFYYSKKISARAMCSPLQHQIVTKGLSREQNGISILSLGDYGYGTAGGCLGINCGHYLTPFIVGVNSKPDLPDYLKSVTPSQAEENARVQAQQRAFEREIRKNKERLHIAKAIGDDELIQKYRLKGVNLNATYRAYIDEHPFLARHVNRERYYYNPDSYAKQEFKLQKEKSVQDRQRLEQAEMRYRFTSAVKNGIIKAEINEQKQSDHIKGTNEWNRRLETDLANGKQFEPSYLTITMDEAAELIKRYSGTGQFRYSDNEGYIPKKEIVKHSDKIGVYIDQSTGETVETDSFRIHYRKTGAHIVPTLRGKK